MPCKPTATFSTPAKFQYLKESDNLNSLGRVRAPAPAGRPLPWRCASACSCTGAHRVLRYIRRGAARGVRPPYPFLSISISFAFHILPRHGACGVSRLAAASLRRPAPLRRRPAGIPLRPLAHKLRRRRSLP